MSGRPLTPLTAEEIGRLGGPFYKPHELAEKWGCSERTLKRVAREHRLCYVLGSAMTIEQKDADILETLVKPHKLSKARPRRNVVYFLRCGDYVKIGYSKEYTRRFRAISTVSPYELIVLATLPGSMKVEREFHKRFAAYHHRAEWFRLEGELADFIAEISSPQAEWT